MRNRISSLSKTIYHIGINENILLTRLYFAVPPPHHGGWGSAQGALAQSVRAAAS